MNPKTWGRAWPIGVEMDARTLKLAQFQRRGRGLLLAAQEAPLPEAGDDPQARAEAASRALRQAMHSGAFVGHTVVSTLSPDRLHQHHLEMAPMPERELASAVTWQMAHEMGAATEAFNTQYLNLGRVSQQDKPMQQVLAIAARLADLDRHVAMFQRAGLSVDVIDIPAAAMTRRLSGDLTRPAGDNARIIVHVACHTTTFVIAAGGEPRFASTANTGTHALIERLAHKQNLSREDAEAVYRRVRTGPQPGGADTAAETQAVRDAGRLLIDELTRHTGMFLNYYGRKFRTDAPRVGTAIGEVDDAFVSQLAEKTGLTLQEIDQTPITLDSAAVDEPPPPHLQRACAVACGLSLYHRQQPRTKGAA